MTERLELLMGEGRIKWASTVIGPVQYLVEIGEKTDEQGTRRVGRGGMSADNKVLLSAWQSGTVDLETEDGRVFQIVPEKLSGGTIDFRVAPPIPEK